MSEQQKQPAGVKPGKCDVDGYDYVPFDADDPDYFGARYIIDEELKYIAACRNECPSGSNASKPTGKNTTGLALSGGGIRSASFSLGVMQALAYAGWMERIDYLSTVSGGGYAGSALSWLLHKEWDSPEDRRARCLRDDDGNEEGAKAKLSFGLGRDDFPFGTHPIASGGSRSVAAGMSGASPRSEKYHGRMLRFLRQHASYLTPGGGIDGFSLAAVLLRNIMFGIIFYATILVLLFGLLGWMGWVPSPCAVSADFDECVRQLSHDPSSQRLFAWAGWAMVLWSGMAVIYALVSRFFGQDYFFGRGETTNYRYRYFYDRWAGRIPLMVALALVLVGSIPAIHAGIGALLIDKWGWFAGGALMMVGTMLSAFILRRTSALVEGRVPTGLIVWAASSALLFGLLLLAYHIYLSCWSLRFSDFPPLPAGFRSMAAVVGMVLFGGVVLNSALAGWKGCFSHDQFDLGGLPAWLGLFAIIVFLARFSNINYLSLHRYYRDRLMETFLPNVSDALDVMGFAGGASKRYEADGVKLYQLDPRNAEEGSGDIGNGWGIPLHIINANIVLVSSRIPKFRARGGDNFVMTPLFRGSNATGWCGTGGDGNKGSPFEPMTLATAMAISGAAVNPHTGVGGEGITRRPLLSFLMGVFNIRLGYWADNPAPASETLHRLERIDRKQGWGGCLRCLKRVPRLLLSSRLLHDKSIPNTLYPGLTELFMQLSLDENSRMVQLTDGGHFENLGLYELVRRRLRVIIVCDGEEDKDFKFSGLANAIEKVRADFGAIIEIDSGDLERLIPKGEGAASFAKAGFLVASIRYSRGTENENTRGTLIYLKTTFFDGLSADLRGYRAGNPDFPDQSTSDQFFDEKQFEAYRELGFQTARAMMLDQKGRRFSRVVESLGVPRID